MADWTDPGFVAARKARAEAYAEFCMVATSNPHRFGQPQFDAYYEMNVVPVKEAFMKASEALTRETTRVLLEDKHVPDWRDEMGES